jgi:hypothetical protein
MCGHFWTLWDEGAPAVRLRLASAAGLLLLLHRRLFGAVIPGFLGGLATLPRRRSASTSQRGGMRKPADAACTSARYVTSRVGADDVRGLLELTASIAADYVESLGDRRVFPDVTPEHSAARSPSSQSMRARL